MRDIVYPLTICFDRYQGAYSGAAFTAWNLDPFEVPEEIGEDDISCMMFWNDNPIPCGKGSNPEEAIADLAKQLAAMETEDSP